MLGLGIYYYINTIKGYAISPFRQLSKCVCECVSFITNKGVCFLFFFIVHTQLVVRDFTLHTGSGHYVLKRDRKEEVTYQTQEMPVDKLGTMQSYWSSESNRTMYTTLQNHTASEGQVVISTKMQAHNGCKEKACGSLIWNTQLCFKEGKYLMPKNTGVLHHTNNKRLL